MSKPTVTTVRGKLSYAKVLGEPVYNKFKKANEWKFDVEIDKDTVKELTGLGIKTKIKMKSDYLDGKPYLSFSQNEFRKDRNTGSDVRNDPIDIKDILGKPWDGNKLLGNGTVADVKFKINPYGDGLIGIYVQSVRILDHVPYGGKQFEDIDESDPYYQAAQAAKAAAAPSEPIPDEKEELDDEIPF